LIEPSGQPGNQVRTRSRTLSTQTVLTRLLVGGLALVLLVGAVACASAGISSTHDLTPPTFVSTRTPPLSPTSIIRSTLTPSTAPALPGSTDTPNPVAKIHNATAQDIPLFVSVTFTPPTTFDQAVAALGGAPYPWTCDDPRTPVPPSLDEQRAIFTGTHTLLISYPTWERLVQIAASSLVISVDGTALYQCS
jgi:hypothetical protein